MVKVAPINDDHDEYPHPEGSAGHVAPPSFAPQILPPGDGTPDEGSKLTLSLRHENKTGYTPLMVCIALV